MSENTPEQPGLPSYDDAKSIVDTILDLDSFLSGGIRRAEDTFTFTTEPNLEAQIDELNLKLARLEGAILAPAKKPQPGGDDEPLAAAAPAKPAAVDEHAATIREIFDLEQRFASTFRSIKLVQMDPDDFRAFQLQWKDEIAKGDMLLQDQQMPVELITRTAAKPAMTPEKVVAFRKRVSEATYNRLVQQCWALNKQQGVSLPKSSLSSDDLKRAGLEKS